MIAIGQYNLLRVLSKTDEGLTLSDGTEEALLPYQYVPKDTEIGDNIDVFTYVQKDGRLMATTQRPLACVGDFACLTVVDETDDGVFLDIGIGKDIFVPTREQKRPMYRGDNHVVYVFLDERNSRMLASSKLLDFVEEQDFDFEEGDEVSLLIADQTDLGFNAIINNKYIGLLYQNEVFDNLQPGDSRKGWIKKIRVEGKIDLSLQPMGYGHILDTKDKLYTELKESGGVIPLGDKSSPDDIYDRFKISKNAFKKTIGALYKERLITISDYEIRIYVDQEAD